MSDQNALVRFIGKVKSQIFNKKNPQQGEEPTFQKFTVYLDNPKVLNEDGSENTYYRGHLLWFDKETNKHYLVKQVDLSNVGEASRANGFVNSLKLDLGNAYQVEKLD